MTARSSPSPSSSDEEKLPTLQNPPAPKKPTTIGTFLSLLRDEGPTALFAGVLPALVLVVNPILQYTIFEQLRNMLEKRRKVQPLDVFFLGAVGKLLATGITYPYITVKSRMHVASNKEGEAEGMVGRLRRCVSEEGWGGLYKGLFLIPTGSGVGEANVGVVVGIGPKITQSVITAAFLFAFKDALYDLSVQARRKVPKKLAI